MSSIYLKDIITSDLMSKSKFDKKVKKNEWTPAFRDKMRAWEMYIKGCTEQDIARTLNVSYTQFVKHRLEFKRFFTVMKKRRPQDLPRAPRRDSPTEGNPLLSPQALRLFALSGVTKGKIAELVGCSHQAILNYFTRHPEAERIYTNFGELADAKVIFALFKRAVGMKAEKVKFATFEGAITDERKYYEELPPSIEAAMHWLVNRRRWKKSDSAVLTNSKGAILEALEEMTKLDESELDKFDKEFSLQ